MKLNYFILSAALLLASSTTLASSNYCSAMLNQPAQTWINAVSRCPKHCNTPDIANAAIRYGQCVDQDIQQLHTHMLKTNHYPLMGANGDFHDFSAALNNFTTLGLKLSAYGGTYYELKGTYVDALYKKQFKLLFYASYINQTSDPLIKRLKNNPKPNLKELKAYFDKTLLIYSPEQRKALLAAFQPMISQSEFGKNHQEAIYVYALSILEPPSDGTFVTDPF